MMPTEEITYREGVIDKLDGLKDAVEAIDKKVTYTNGKVKRIIIALVLLFGIVIGQNAPTTHDIISILGGFIH